ncbi:MAG: DUF2804 domain-containing protein [Venatoribacter sp.]
MTQLEKLIKPSGKAHFGLFPQGVEDVNYRDFDYRTNMDKPLSLKAKNRAFNQFQFVSFISPELIVGLAIVDLKLVSNAFLYLYQPHTNSFEEYSFLQPFAFKTQFDTQPNQGLCEFKKGKKYFRIEATKTPGVRRVTVEIPNKVSIRASIDEFSQYHPLAICTRAGYNGWVFTQKSNALPCEGQISWNNKQYNLKEIGALAGVDWTGGFMRRETFWNWGSLSCTLKDGRKLGFNLAAGVNETGFTENALWLDGRLIKVDMVDFQFDRYNPEALWHMRSNDGIINLTFKPKGKRTDKTNAFIIASNFSQYFGLYQGEISLPNEVIKLNGEWGLSEDHYAKW